MRRIEKKYFQIICCINEIACNAYLFAMQSIFLLKISFLVAIGLNSVALGSVFPGILPKLSLVFKVTLFTDGLISFMTFCMTIAQK